MKVLYQAEDGTIFNDENACSDYEAEIQHKNIVLIDFFDYENDIYHVDSNDLFNDKIYSDAWKVNIHNHKEFDDFAWLTEVCGWWEFEQINRPGIWVRHEPDNPWGDGIWERVNERICSE